MIAPDPGTWYVVVTCEQCKSTIFLFPDLTEGKSSLVANYIVNCPRCGHKGAYTARHHFHQQMESLGSRRSRKQQQKRISS